MPFLLFAHCRHLVVHRWVLGLGGCANTDAGCFRVQCTHSFGANCAMSVYRKSLRFPQKFDQSHHLIRYMCIVAIVTQRRVFVLKNNFNSIKFDKNAASLLAIDWLLVTLFSFSFAASFRSDCFVCVSVFRFFFSSSFFFLFFRSSLATEQPRHEYIVLIRMVGDFRLISFR